MLIGQQRIISLVLLNTYLGTISEDNCEIAKTNFKNQTSKLNIYYNYKFIENWFSSKDKKYKQKIIDAMQNILEVVIIKVSELSEAFQLFDSQNTRGKELHPHDLLKAYHLRAVKNNKKEKMKKVVEKWERKEPEEIEELFKNYLYPITNWSKRLNTKEFTVKEIDKYKGVSENTSYTYAQRAKKATPYFQITEPFTEGKDFFEMVEHYLKLLNRIKTEIYNNPKFKKIAKILSKENRNAGYNYTKNLFWCILMCYYDKFNNFEEEVVKKLCIWAFLLRVNLKRVGYDSINKYAIGTKENNRNIYSNYIPMFFIISESRLHSEIENIQINTDITKRPNQEWQELYRELLDL